MKTLLIGGAGRSGTTMLGALLADALHGVATPESHFKHELRLETMSGAEAERAIESHWRYQIWEFDAKAAGVRGSDCPTGIDYLQRLVRAYGAHGGASNPAWWVDHTPENTLNWKRLFAAFPDARGIHLVRDGRGVAASIQPLAWGPSTAVGAAEYWEERVRKGLLAEQAFPDRIVRVKYEDLVARPEAVLDVVKEWLGASNGDDDAARGGTFRTPEYTAHQHGLVGKAPDPARAQAWKRAMSSRDIELFEVNSGEMLDTLGYELQFDNPRPESKRERLRRIAIEHVNTAVALPLRRVRTRGPFVVKALVARWRG